MDDFNVSALHESKNEWGARLLTILTPLIIEGCKSILDESIKLCKQNGEKDKYLMTFQNFISRIPKWNSQIIENEKKRIIERSGCGYLEDLITCVHIIQLKLLTAIRVGQKQKKINIKIPKLEDFIHKVYINVARKIYKNVYLFELNIPPLQIQKHNRELEIIIQECILHTIRESLPVETILKAYMDETIEEDVTEEVKEEYIDKPVAVNPNEQKLKFNNLDNVFTEKGNTELVTVPKTIEHLEEVSLLRNEQRKLEEMNNSSDDNEKLQISDELLDLNSLGIETIDGTESSNNDNDTLPPLLDDDIEILED
jgi:hypothetical protein